ncbi:hypothetical protein F4703DRAFT_1798915 [Phycomyces blakesleeanus]|uniref:Uncharacterized protein n=1 Tax=Phycomyces blakesleeanus (strain ATCC 8743b / DSM 1359 / FGSC 10004 / NBRC 33097 / NRRL 1555) TaxID=763407 RepID=A0A162ZW02_PHYB8|nr:hypothetical protein PHYBLDRAFT_78507 [Phycomyces blakesleeanus NRRL 1555(-)]OAD69401.1 hypothetical protein PHYBLDRAFT_78507 [Phycomyces blakesleeanus NRRL 1555(-)]|eukprot:XP_018287441.1 hypothetical protein PHYBLDRAFT_78507 [Phycomyces blakesleeanus NRRL 1555(-)]
MPVIIVTFAILPILFSFLFFYFNMSTINNSVNQNQNSLESKQNEARRLEMEYDALVNECRDQEYDIEFEKKRQQELQKNHQSLSSNLTKLRQQLDTLRSQGTPETYCEYLRQELKANLELDDQLKAQLEPLTEQLESLEQECNNDPEVLRQKDEKIHELKAELERVQSKLRSLRQ